MQPGHPSQPAASAVNPGAADPSGPPAHAPGPGPGSPPSVQPGPAPGQKKKFQGSKLLLIVFVLATYWALGLGGLVYWWIKRGYPDMEQKQKEQRLKQTQKEMKVQQKAAKKEMTKRRKAGDMATPMAATPSMTMADQAGFEKYGIDDPAYAELYTWKRIYKILGIVIVVSLIVNLIPPLIVFLLFVPLIAVFLWGIGGRLAVRLFDPLYRLVDRFRKPGQYWAIMEDLEQQYQPKRWQDRALMTMKRTFPATLLVFFIVSLTLRGVIDDVDRDDVGEFTVDNTPSFAVVEDRSNYTVTVSEGHPDIIILDEDGEILFQMNNTSYAALGLEEAPEDLSEEEVGWFKANGSTQIFIDVTGNGTVHIQEPQLQVLDRIVDRQGALVIGTIMLGPIIAAAVIPFLFVYADTALVKVDPKRSVVKPFGKSVEERFGVFAGTSAIISIIAQAASLPQGQGVLLLIGFGILFVLIAFPMFVTIYFYGLRNPIYVERINKKLREQYKLHEYRLEADEAGEIELVHRGGLPADRRQSGPPQGGPGPGGPPHGGPGQGGPPHGGPPHGGPGQPY